MIVVPNKVKPHNSFRIQVELFPLRSQLLGESLLVSFLPLNNMLKFGGLSYKFDSRAMFTPFLPSTPDK